MSGLKKVWMNLIVQQLFYPHLKVYLLWYVAWRTWRIAGGPEAMWSCHSNLREPGSPNLPLQISITSPGMVLDILWVRAWQLQNIPIWISLFHQGKQWLLNNTLLKINLENLILKWGPGRIEESRDICISVKKGKKIMGGSESLSGGNLAEDKGFLKEI